MKKYIFLLAITIVAILTSCTNDDITISKIITVKVDPSHVITPFPEEWPGELESFDTSFKLRVRLLIYDKDGLLAYSDSTFLENYKKEMSISQPLPLGTYTVIATTDIVKISGSTISAEYWNLYEKDNINNASIKYTDDYSALGKYRILGVTSQKVEITGDSQSLTLYPTPAGALIRTYYFNVVGYTNVSYFALWTNRGCSMMTFDSNGTPKMIPENNNNEYDFLCSAVDAKKASGNELYSWHFIFPVDNISFQFTWYNLAGDAWLMGDPISVSSIKAGEEYLLAVNCLTDETAWGKFESSSTRAFQAQEKPINIIAGMKKSGTSLKQSRKLIDLIRK